MTKLETSCGTSGGAPRFPQVLSAISIFSFKRFTRSSYEEKRVLSREKTACMFDKPRIDNNAIMIFSSSMTSSQLTNFKKFSVAKNADSTAVLSASFWQKFSSYFNFLIYKSKKGARINPIR